MNTTDFLTRRIISMAIDIFAPDAHTKRACVLVYVEILPKEICLACREAKQELFVIRMQKLHMMLGMPKAEKEALDWRAKICEILIHG